MERVVIGIDISKKTLDWCVTESGRFALQSKGSNTAEAVIEQLSTIQQRLNASVEEILICAEYTGKYVYPLTVACNKVGVLLCLEDAYLVSLSAKRERGKNDKVDAKRIAAYAIKNREELRPYNFPAPNAGRLRHLISIQQDFVVERQKYVAKIKDYKGYVSDDMYEEMSAKWQDFVDNAEKHIKKIDREIDNIIKTDAVMSHQNKLLQTVPGIGPKMARYLISSTSAFTAFKDARKYCCYTGVAPFDHSSGTSVHSKPRVSDRANKELKKQLHMAAMSAATICKSSVFRDYYERKVAEGKNPMSVLNAVRSKLVQVAFAVIRDDKPFDPKHEYKAK